MKAIILVLSPKESRDLLSGDLSVLVRKRFPKNYVGWVYIYVAKDKEILSFDTISKNGKTYYDGFNDKDFDFQFMTLTKTDINNGWGWFASERNLNGKVVARFNATAEEIETKLTALGYVPYTKTLSIPCLLKNSCLTIKELDDYLQGKIGYVIHINDLKIFDKPKEIKEFYKVGCEEYFTKHVFVDHPNFRPIYESELKQFQFTRAPRSGWCYVEV